MAQVLDLQDRIALMPRRVGRDTGPAHQLAGIFSDGRLSVEISPGVAYGLLCDPGAPQWWYLSYRADAARKVVIASDRYECAALHATQAPLRNDTQDYSYLDGQALHELFKALSGSRTACFVALDILQLEPLDADKRQKYLDSPKAPLGLLSARIHEAPAEKLRGRKINNTAYRLAKGGGNHFDVKGLPEMSNQATQAFRSDLSMLARALAQGFVHLSSLHRFRDAGSPDGFINKPTLLRLLELPRRYILIDIPQLEDSC
jgi:hypothetical protein